MGHYFIDLSVPIDSNAKEFTPPKIDYMNHDETVERMAKGFGIPLEQWPLDRAWATEVVSLATHTGTHIDAPYHYWDYTGDKPAKKIDELPLDWFYGPGVVLNFTWKKPGEIITKEDVIHELERINHTLSAKEIVLFHTGADKHLYSPDYLDIHPGVSAEATRFLIQQGIKVMGTDGYGWDVPFKVHGDMYKKTNDPNVLWEAHYVGKELEYCQIEKLANLDQIPKPAGFTVIAFPIKIAGASAGWARPVALISK